MLPRSQVSLHWFKIAAASKRSGRVYKPGPAWNVLGLIATHWALCPKGQGRQLSYDQENSHLIYRSAFSWLSSTLRS